MPHDFLVYIGRDGKSPRRAIGRKAPPRVSPADFRLAVLENPPAVSGLSPSVAGLQAAVLHAVAAVRLRFPRLGNAIRG